MTVDTGSLLAILAAGRGRGSGLTETAITALLDCFAHVKWDTEDGDGSAYYNALAQALGASVPVAGTVDNSKDITLSDTLPADTYTLRYEDSQGEALSDYAPLCQLNLDES